MALPSPEHALKPRAGLISAKIGDEVVFLDVEAGRYFAMDPIGSRVFALLEQGLGVEAVCEKLAGEYEVDLRTCRDDVKAFVGQLIDCRLLTAAQS